MSLRHALLGLLVRAPASGYDLTKTFEHTLGRFAWQARHSQIYPELKRLADEGKVEIVGSGARGRKTYRTTATGQAEFREWMMRTPEAGVRNEFVLRLFLVSSLDRDEAVTLLRGYADEAERQLTGIRSFLDEHEPAWERDPLDYGHLAADYSLRMLGAIHAWALSAVDRIEHPK
jgi:PadR family transcriptional regulator, regulatory protein AphA